MTEFAVRAEAIGKAFGQSWAVRDLSFTVPTEQMFCLLGPSGSGKTAGQISGGMQRRVMLAAALLHEPALPFMDEPTAGLDPILRTRLWQEFRRLNDAGTTLIVTTQYVSEAEYCDQIAILSDGTLAAAGTPHELRRRALGGEIVKVHAPGFNRAVVEALEQHERVISVETPSYDQMRITVDKAGQAMPILLAILQNHNVTVESIDDVDPTFDEVFVRLVETYRAGRPDAALPRSPRWRRRKEKVT